MNVGESVLDSLHRLYRTAASLHVRVESGSTNAQWVHPFMAVTGLPTDCGLFEFWTATVGGLPLLIPGTGGHGVRRFTSLWLPAVQIAWEGGTTEEVTLHSGPLAGQTIRHISTGTRRLGRVKIAIADGGEAIFVLATAGPIGPGGTVVAGGASGGRDETVLAESFGSFLAAAVDLIEANPDAAFFHGDHTQRMFKFPGTQEAERQLVAGLGPGFLKGGSTLLERAVEHRRTDLIPVFLRVGVPAGRALIDAYMSNQHDAMDLMLAGGVDPNLRFEDGTPALCHAASERKVKAVARLLAFGADPNARDPSGHTPLALALARPDDYKSREVVDLVRRAGGTT